MREESRKQREREILDAALQELRLKGYRGCTMLAIARRARASKETLYAWYGDKRGLFRALVAANAEAIKDRLTATEAGESDPLESLRDVGAGLLALLLGDRAVAINRAAAADADESGELGRALSAAGRESVLPLICALLLRARAAGRLSFDEVGRVADAYLGLLISDLQVRRIIGVLAEPDPGAVRDRADLAVTHLRRLYAPETPQQDR